jgi:predicted phage terminase large subunit-like protein
MMFTAKEQAERSLYTFFMQAWPIIEGNTKFIDEWFLEVIAEHLELVYKREIKNLLINIPPRLGKTSLISVAFPAWVWIQDASEKIITASCTNTLSLQIADKSRLLIESSWYQENWGSLFKIRDDQNSKSYFANDKMGYRISTSVGSTIIGRGGNLQITDDPNVVGGESEVVRDSVNNWWSMKWYNRLDDLANDRRVLVQQRGDEKDVSGSIIANDINNEWVKLILPLEYEEESKRPTVPLFWTHGKPWEDIRTVEGELLTKRLTGDNIKQLKKELGSYTYAALYQQRPAPLEGGILKKHWFKIYKYSQLPQIDYTIQSWDTALTANDNSAYSACTTWGLFQDRYDNTNVILLSAWRGKLEYPELRERVKRLSTNYLDVGEIAQPYSIRYVPDQIVIEAKATGDPLLQDLRRAGVYGRAFDPKKYGDKTQRVRLITPLIEAGIVWMPAQANNPDKMADFADEFVNEVSYFPNPRSLDYTDTMTQALITLRDGNSIKNPRDYYEPDDKSEDTIRWYG